MSVERAKTMLAGELHGGRAARWGRPGGLAVDLDHFRARVLQDALTTATADHWDKRAREWRAAAPTPDDFHGHCTREELREQWRRCMDTALACQRHADLIRSGRPEPIAGDVWDALEEASA